MHIGQQVVASTEGPLIIEGRRAPPPGRESEAPQRGEKVREAAAKTAGHYK